MRAQCLLPETKSNSKKILLLINFLVVWSLDRQQMRKVPPHSAIKINRISKMRATSHHQITFHRKGMGNGRKRNTQGSLRVSKYLARIGSKYKITSEHVLVRRLGPTRRNFSESYKGKRNSRSCWSSTSSLWKRRRLRRGQRILKRVLLPRILWNLKRLRLTQRTCMGWKRMS